MGGNKFLLPRWGRLGREAHAARITTSGKPGDLLEQRRTQRVLVAMPVLIYGRLGNEPFQEDTETINVSANGGLLPITTEVLPSQKLLLTNLQTNEELTCRVARLVQTPGGRTLVGLEFLQPAPRFWGGALTSPHVDSLR
ncbi:MAG: PilZ domain-containing protein [Candidatus Acidiferrales bacterium]